MFTFMISADVSSVLIWEIIFRLPVLKENKVVLTMWHMLCIHQCALVAACRRPNTAQRVSDAADVVMP